MPTHRSTCRLAGHNDVRLRVAHAVSVTSRRRRSYPQSQERICPTHLERRSDSLPDDPVLLSWDHGDRGQSGKPGDVAYETLREYRRPPQRMINGASRTLQRVFSAGRAADQIVTPGADSLHGDIAVQSRATPLEVAIRSPTQTGHALLNYMATQGPIVGAGSVSARRATGSRTTTPSCMRPCSPHRRWR